MSDHPSNRALIVTCMRNEGVFVLEWLAHHKAIGFTDFLIYSNDCNDGTDELLNRLMEMGEVIHLDNPPMGKKTVQWQALSAAADHPVMQEVDWIFGTDVDEFLNIKVGNGHLNDLFTACPEATGFALSWRMFGNNGIATFEDEPVTTQFTHCAPTRMLWPWRAMQFKCLYKNDGVYAKLGVHRPRKPDPAKEAQSIWRDGSGNPLPWHAPQASTVIPNFDDHYNLAQINHYALGSLENFLVKKMRGKPNHAKDAIDLEYWTERNFNAEQDDSIQKVARLSNPILQSYMSDPIVSELHRKAVAWRKDEIKRLLDDKDAYQLYEQVLQFGDSEVLSRSVQKKYLFQLMQAQTQRPNNK